MMKSACPISAPLQYVAFDKCTGRILHKHSGPGRELNDGVEIPIEELRKLCPIDSFVLANLTDRNSANLEFLKVTSQDCVLQGPIMVDTVQRTLVPQPRLSLSAEKCVLVGDGKDTATITLAVIGAQGQPVRGFTAKVKVTTTRRKLSTPGGVLDLTEGAATITLTSVAETVSNVRVQATVLNGLCVPSHITLEFL